MDENNVNNQEGNVYVVGTRGYSAYEVAVLNGFEGTVDEWLASLVGPQGEIGPTGPDGPAGPTGLTPRIRVGSVTTGEPNTNVIITITGTPEVPIINFTIPKGAKGDTGATGSTNYTEMSNKPQIGGITLQGNLSLVELGIQPAGSYLTSDDLTDYVKNTDYATWNKGGVVKTGNGFDLTNGIAKAGAYSYANYLNQGVTQFISKGTLENVITGKGLVSNNDYATNLDGGKAGVINVGTYGTATGTTSGQLYCASLNYSDYTNQNANYFISKGTLENVLANRIGTIDSVLDAINGEVI